MTTKLGFDAERYCRHNKGRMGKWLNGEDIATLIADEVKTLREEIIRLTKEDNEHKEI